MKKLLEIALGVVTSIGGFLDVGSIATAAQAGAAYGYRLAWAIGLGTLCVIFLVEMCGRLGAVSGHTVPDAIRERFGFSFFLIPLGAMLLVSFLVLAAEIGGVCLALELVTGIGRSWWAMAVAFVIWLVLWKGSFTFIEDGVSLLGLVTVVFVVAAFKLHPSWTELGRGLLPSLPPHEPANYWFIAVSILGASVTPYIFFFYSSGAIEDRWDESHLWVNRIVATLGMSFGGMLSLSILVVSALVFHPAGIRIDRYDQAALMLTSALGSWGFWLFAAALGIACAGAALEVALAMAYLLAQGLGWNWTKNARPRDTARFSAAYTLIVPAAAVPILIGVDPLGLTLASMALAAATMPLTIAPFLVLMNDRHYVGDHPNGWIGNAVVLFTVVLGCVLAVVSLPLQWFGS